MGNKKTNSLRPVFELVRQIKYSNGKVAQWGPSYYVEEKSDAIKQIWSDLEVLTKTHINANDPCKVSFDAVDNPTASFTFPDKLADTSTSTDTITWRIEKRTKIVA